MKIIQLIQKPQRRGAEIFAAQLSEQLRLTGNEVLLISIFEGESDLPFYGEWIKLNRPIGYRFFDFKGWKQFSRIVKDFIPDIIQANAADTLKFSVLSKKVFGWKTPIIYRNANQMGDFIRGSLHRELNQFLVKHVSAVVSVSQASQLDFHNCFKFPKSNSICIPIGIDTKAIDDALEESLVIKLPDNFLLQIGGLVAEKDPLEMVRIFSMLKKKHNNLHLIFIGSGPLEDALEEEIKINKLKEHVHLFPSRNNIFPILARAKALVMPSKIEGLPGVILEAMYCKIPIITYDIGGISEVINCDSGYLIKAGNSDDFKNGIENLLGNSQDLRDKVTSKAFQIVNEKYSIFEISKKFEIFYKSSI